MSSTAPPSIWGRALVYLGLWEEPESYDPGVPDTPESLVREPAASAAAPAATPERGNVRPLRLAARADAPRTEVVHVTAFEDCEVIGRRYREGAAVLFDLADVDRTTGRRVVDFVAGATYVLRGDLSKVGRRAFLLVPEGTAVSPEEQLRLEARGYRVADGA